MFSEAPHRTHTSYVTTSTQQSTSFSTTYHTLHHCVTGIAAEFLVVTAPLPLETFCDMKITFVVWCVGAGGQAQDTHRRRDL